MRRWDRLKRRYYERVDFGDPMRYVHLFDRECWRPSCWCHFDPTWRREDPPPPWVLDPTLRPLGIWDGFR